MAENSFICAMFSMGAAAGGYFLRMLVANASSARKEDWDRLRTLTQDVHNIADTATQFYCSPPQEPHERRELGIKIQGLLRVISQDALQLAQVINDVTVTGYTKRLRMAISHAFDSSHTEPLAVTDPIIIKIEQEAISCIGALHLSYCKRYRKIYTLTKG